MAYDTYRALELIIGPFKDGQTGASNGSINILSTGSVDTFKVHARITKHLSSAANLSTIAVWNLSKDTINRISSEPNLRVKLLVGYEKGNFETLYTGGIVSVVNDKVGENLITKITCRTLLANMLTSQYSKTYNAGTQISTIIKETASTIQGVIIDPTMIKIKGTIGPQGWSFVGSAKEALDKLAYQYGFSWNINNDVLVAYKDGTGKETGIVLDETAGLQKVSPQLFGLVQIQKGLDVESLYIPGIQPFHVYTVKSRVNQKSNGKFLLHTVEYDLCPKTDAWTMNMSFTTLYGGENG